MARRWWSTAGRWSGAGRERPNTEAIDLHDEVARAIRLQDEVAAEKAMRAIIDEAAAAVTEEFCGAEPSTSSPPSHD